MGQVQTERATGPQSPGVLFAGNYAALPDTSKQPILLDRPTSEAIVTGSSFELAAALVAAACAIAGLADVLPVRLAALATLGVGFALLAQSTTLAARWSDAVKIRDSERAEAVGIGTEMFGGLGGIALGVLALVDILPFILLPVAAITIGVALLLGGPTQPELAEVAPASSVGKHYRVTRRAVRTSGGVMAMAGLGAVVLGALALLVSTGPIVTLCLAAMLCIASALVLAGGAVTARFARRLA